MPRVFLTPLVIAGLLFLPSCAGNSGGDSGENSTQDKCANIQRFVSDEKAQANSILQSAESARAVNNWDVALDLAAKFNNKTVETSKYVLDNKNCFLEQEILEAQKWVDTYE